MTRATRGIMIDRAGKRSFFPEMCFTWRCLYHWVLTERVRRLEEEGKDVDDEDEEEDEAAEEPLYRPSLGQRRLARAIGLVALLIACGLWAMVPSAMWWMSKFIVAVHGATWMMVGGGYREMIRCGRLFKLGFDSYSLAHGLQSSLPSPCSCCIGRGRS